MTPAPEDPIAPVPPAHPLVAIEVLLSEALRLAESEIARSSTLAERVVEVCESEVTRARIRIALAAAGRWSAAAGVESPARRAPSEGLPRGLRIATPGGPVSSPSEGGRAGGVSSPAPGAVPEPFALPTPPFVIGVGVPYDALPPVDQRPFRERVRPKSP